MSISVLLYQSLKLLHMNYTTALHITKFQVSFSFWKIFMSSRLGVAHVDYDHGLTTQQPRYHNL